jgi:hypothetical protein
MNGRSSMKNLLRDVGFESALILVLVLTGCTGVGSTSTSPASGVSGSAASHGPGGLIVFRRGINGRHSIYTMTPDGSALTPLTPTPGGDNDDHPWLSPDGRQVIFERRINENHFTSTTTAPERGPRGLMATVER